jgi:hypothetical protein
MVLFNRAYVPFFESSAAATLVSLSLKEAGVNNILLYSACIKTLVPASQHVFCATAICKHFILDQQAPFGCSFRILNELHYVFVFRLGKVCRHGSSIFPKKLQRNNFSIADQICFFEKNI